MTKLNKVGLIAYGSGNYKSVYNALDFLKIKVLEIRNPLELKKVNHIILPGVGAFHSTMGRLEEQGFINGLKEEVLQYNKYFLGICVGMQILAGLGTEFKTCQGLDFISGNVARIDAKEYGLSVPNIGWREVNYEKNSLLFHNIPNASDFYFLHSYHFVPELKEHITSTCDYGSALTASIEKNNIFGVQFHPEKSQLNGLQVLKNFSSL
jgi:imidazole glycerol-phosphate synthase subunit HisH